MDWPSAYSRTYRRIRRMILARRRMLAGLFAAGAVALGLQAARAPAVPTTTVLTAAHDVPAGVTLKSGDLATAAFTPDSVPAGALDAAAVLGRTTAGPLREGEPLTDVRLLDASLLAQYPGLVAAPVRIGDRGSVELLRVGDRIDIVAADPQGRTDAFVVAEAAPVLSIPQGEDTSFDSTGIGSGGLVVLAVPEETARDLAQAAVTAFLSLVIGG